MGIPFSTLNSPQLGNGLVSVGNPNAPPSYSSAFIVGIGDTNSFGFSATFGNPGSRLGIRYTDTASVISTAACSITYSVNPTTSRYYGFEEVTGYGSVLCSVANTQLGAGPVTVTMDGGSYTATYALYVGQTTATVLDDSTDTTTLIEPGRTTYMATETFTEYATTKTLAATATLTGVNRASICSITSTRPSTTTLITTTRSSSSIDNGSDLSSSRGSSTSRGSSSSSSSSASPIKISTSLPRTATRSSGTTSSSRATSTSHNISSARSTSTTEAPSSSKMSSSSKKILSTIDSSSVSKTSSSSRRSSSSSKTSSSTPSKISSSSSMSTLTRSTLSTKSHSTQPKTSNSKSSSKTSSSQSTSTKPSSKSSSRTTSSLKTSSSPACTTGVALKSLSSYTSIASHLCKDILSTKVEFPSSISVWPASLLSSACSCYGKAATTKAPASTKRFPVKRQEIVDGTTSIPSSTPSVEPSEGPTSTLTGASSAEALDDSMFTTSAGPVLEAPHTLTPTEIGSSSSTKSSADPSDTLFSDTGASSTESASETSSTDSPSMISAPETSSTDLTSTTGSTSANDLTSTIDSTSTLDPTSTIDTSSASDLGSSSSVTTSFTFVAPTGYGPPTIYAVQTITIHDNTATVYSTAEVTTQTVTTITVSSETLTVTGSSTVTVDERVAPTSCVPDSDVVALSARSLSCTNLSLHTAFLWVMMKQPFDFCAYYLTANRNLSPLSEMSASTLKDTCSCLVSHKSAPLPVFEIGASFSQKVNRVCKQSVATLIKGKFKEPEVFCKFYASTARSISPFPGLTPGDVFSGCKCLA